MRAVDRYISSEISVNGGATAECGLTGCAALAAVLFRTSCGSLLCSHHPHEGNCRMTARAGGVARVPWHVSLFSPILKFLLAAGVPMGFNGLITIRGRKSGQPRTTAVAVIAVSGRRWVWAPWGEVQWVRNLRAASGATITVRGHEEEVRATELDPAQRIGFFRDTLGPLARSIPLGVWFIRTVDGVDLNDPVAAAEGRYVFELLPPQS
jgi:deazaflavin-dependent oxidoreductase (nitroreductase family)